MRAPWLVILIGSHALLGSGAIQQPPAHSDRTPVELEIKNVSLRMASDLTLQIKFLRGRMEPTMPERPVTFDDKNSFLIEADYAETRISAADLSRLLNNHAFAYSGAPLKDLRATTVGSSLRLTGKLRKIPFEIEGTLAPTDDGNLRFHPVKIHAAHLPVKGLLHLFGQNLSKFINLHDAHGVRMQGDDLIMMPQRMLPPPHLRARVTAVSIAGDTITQVFGSRSRATPLNPPVKTGNYIYHRGGVLRFGKLTMNDADLEIVGENTNGNFDFFLDNYNRQLVAGHSQNTPSQGLIVYMPDYAQVTQAPPAAPKKKGTLPPHAGSSPPARRR
jgi:hypothetical protein